MCEKIRKLFEKVKWHHILLLTSTFFILDLTSTYIGLQMGAMEVGLVAKDFDFNGIILFKFVALIVLILAYVQVINKNELMAERAVYLVSGISLGIFISNVHQIIYLMQM